jgi:hypothetical protein
MMSTGFYKLVGHEVVPVYDIEEWARGFDTKRHVAQTKKFIGHVYISTVFLGLDHSFFSDIPLLFETMIFGGRDNRYQERYSTWDEAVKGHKRAVRRARG